MVVLQDLRIVSDQLPGMEEVQVVRHGVVGLVVDSPKDMSRLHLKLVVGRSTAQAVVETEADLDQDYREKAPTGDREPGRARNARVVCNHAGRCAEFVPTCGIRDGPRRVR